jgi:hypothetical protein
MSDTNDTAEGILSRERGLLSEFQFFVLTPSNTSNAITTPIAVGSGPVTQAQVILHIDDITDRVWLSRTLGWEPIGAAGTISTILITILRGTVVGTPIFSTRQSQVSTGGIDDYVTTSFSHVDFPATVLPIQTPVAYTLTVQAETTALAIRGPVTFTGVEIERNRICNP